MGRSKASCRLCSGGVAQLIADQKVTMAKILVVDDQVENRALVVALVNYRGHQALEAADGAEALAVVRAEHPDLVFSDILMPTMDGYEFVRQLRAEPEIAKTEVIFYSAHYLEKEAHNLAKDCGVSQVLMKPCEPEDILLAIDLAIGFAPDTDQRVLGTDQVARATAHFFQQQKGVAFRCQLQVEICQGIQPPVGRFKIEHFF